MIVKTKTAKVNLNNTLILNHKKYFYTRNLLNTLKKIQTNKLVNFTWESYINFSIK